MKRKKGTNYGYAYSACVIASPGIRVILHTMPMTEFTRNEEMLKEVITEARKYVDIEAVLVDREFFTYPSIQELETLTVKYVMPVKKNRKKLLQSLRAPCKAKIPLRSINVPVIAVENPVNVAKTLYYCTTLDISNKNLGKIISIYKKRWVIENVFLFSELHEAIC